MAEQEALAGNQEKKRSSWPLEEGFENSQGLQEYCEVMKGEN